MARDDGNDEVHFPRPGPRRPTDIPCAILFLACIASMVGTVCYSLKEGETRRLTHGFDFQGRLCGVDPEVADKKFLYYCGAQGAWDGEFPRKLNFKSKTCVDECPANNSAKIACLMHAFHNFTKLPGGVIQNNLTYVVTLNLEISQSVTYQTSYPTEEFRGKYCVPQWRANNSLKEDVIYGPLKRISNISVAVGSFRHAWPVILTAALLAAGLGIMYLYLLRYYAGPLIFISLCVGTILLILMGFFFLLGIFMNPWDSTGGYQRLNPLFRSFYGTEAKAYSVIIGLCLTTGGVFLGLMTWTSAPKIDESIGIIHAACDCMFAPGPGRLDLLSQPFFEALILLVVMVLAFLGFMLACSVGGIEDTGIIINNDRVSSLQKSFQFHWWWRPVLGLYAISTLWLLEYIVACGHFVVSYAVCLWYFTEIESTGPSESVSHIYKDAQAGNLKRVGGVRVQGVSSVDGRERAGYIEKGPGGKVLVVPIERKGPGGALDVSEALAPPEVKEMQCGSVLRGVNVGIFFHSGSIALGAIVVTLTRPLRWVSHIIKAIVGKAEEQGHIQQGDKTPGAVATAGLSLLSTLLDTFFGGYSKNAYTDMVLSAAGFVQASHDSLDFLAEAGGVVAFLHGSTALYEMIGVGCITLICGGLTFLLLTQVPFFYDQESHWFVSDPWGMTVLSSGVATMIGFGFMSLFNVTADTLLYVFAWSRKHHSQDIQKYCPHALKRLVGRELDDEPESQVLQARSKAKRNPFQKAAMGYGGTIMSSMRGTQGAEQRPLLPNASYQ